MKKFSKRLINAVVVVIVLLIAALAYLFIQRSNSNFPDFYQLGDQVGPLTFRSMGNEASKIEKGKWYLIVLLTDLERNFSFIKYVDHLAVNKFSDPCLRIFIFNVSPETIIHRFKEENEFSIPILSVQDNRSIIKRLFKPPLKQRAARLIDSSGKIVFTADFIQENDVRQILEKYLLGNIDYKDINKGKGRLKVGDFFIPLNAIDIKSGEETVIDKELSPHIWIIFTSNCVSCALKSNLLTYSAIEVGLLSKLKISKGLIFSPYFNLGDINRRLEELKIQDSAYLAKDELEGIENSYFRSSSPENNAIIAITDGENKIIYLESFQVFINHLKGDYFEKNENLFH